MALLLLLEENVFPSRPYRTFAIVSALALALTHCGGTIEFSDEPLSENPVPPAPPAQPTAPVPSSVPPTLAGSTLFTLQQMHFGAEMQSAASENFQLVRTQLSSLEAP